MELEIKQKSLPNPDELYDQGKTSLGDLRELKVGTGSSIFFTDKEGSRWGHHTFESAKAWIKVDGTAQFKTADGDILLSTNAIDGNFINVINTALNTASKTILTDFTFQSTDYAGAFKAGNPTWDENTGLITGGSGVLINARGILGANEGTATFTLDATTGNATFAGTLVAASGTLGTITSGTIIGATIQTAATGYRVRLSNYDSIDFLYNDLLKGSINADDDDTMLYTSTANHTFFDNTSYVMQVNNDGINLPSTERLTFVGGGRIGYTSGAIKFDGASGGDVTVVCEGNINPNSDNSYDLGTGSKRWRKGYFEDIQVDDIFINKSVTVGGSPGKNGSTRIITALDFDGSQLRYKYRDIGFNYGVLNSWGGESGWNNVS